MNKYLSSSLNNIVSWNMDTSWAARSLQEALEARFQQRQMQEKEEKLLKLYENQQQRAFDRVSRGSAGSSNSNNSVGSTGGGKVRQMFDERRQKAGIDKSYPLQPLKSRNNSRGGSMDRRSNISSTSRTSIKSTVQKSVSSVRNGKPVVSKREIVHSIYNNNDGDESYEEHRYKDGNHDIFSSNSHRGIIEMMNNHNIDDSLDNEVLPQIGFDEVDNAYSNVRHSNVSIKPALNGVTRKVESKSTLRSNGVSPVKKDSTPVTKKPIKAPTPTKTAPSPAKSPRNSIPPSPTKTPSSVMSAAANKSKAAPRAPSNVRPSAKQSSKSGVARDDLVECNFCGRRFAADRLQKHEDICSKTGKKKRKVYDATKHRVTGTELEAYVIQGGKKSAVSSKSKQGPKKDWRKTHEEFISAIRAAKQTQAHLAKGGKLSDLPPPPPSTNPDYVQCPHCGRRFNQAAADRHIPKCANYQFNKPKGRPQGKK